MAVQQLTKVYQAIEQQVLAYVGAAGGPQPSFGIGQKDAFNHAKKPRITWLPQGGTVRAPGDAGGDFKSNPRPLWWREFATVAYLWAEGIDALNELAQHLVAAIHAVGHGHYRVIREDWDATGGPEVGTIVAITFTFGIPFVDETTPTVKLGSAPVTGTFTPPGGP